MLADRAAGSVLDLVIRGCGGASGESWPALVGPAGAEPCRSSDWVLRKGSTLPALLAGPLPLGWGRGCCPGGGGGGAFFLR